MILPYAFLVVWLQLYALTQYKNDWAPPQVHLRCEQEFPEIISANWIYSCGKLDQKCGKLGQKLTLSVSFTQIEEQPTGGWTLFTRFVALGVISSICSKNNWNEWLD